MQPGGSSHEPGPRATELEEYELDRTLLQHGLLDELHLWVFPCVAASGDRLLDGVLDGPTHLTVAERTGSRSGITVLTLVPR